MIIAYLDPTESKSDNLVKWLKSQKIPVRTVDATGPYISEWLRQERINELPAVFDDAVYVGNSNTALDYFQ